jgi:Zn finger protein HypA/HybF involved in hydrogenase expression
MAAADCFDLMIDGPDIHCPKCQTPMIAWNWGGQILYTCNGCSSLGFNIERAGIDMDRFRISEILQGTECKGCSRSVEKREAPKVDLYTCSECNVGLFANVKDLEDLHIDFDDPKSCANHREMRTMIGEAYDRLISNLR